MVGYVCVCVCNFVYFWIGGVVVIRSFSKF